MTTPSRPDLLPTVLVGLTVTTGLVDAVSVLGRGRVFTVAVVESGLCLVAAWGAIGYDMVTVHP